MGLWGAPRGGRGRHLASMSWVEGAVKVEGRGWAGQSHSWSFGLPYRNGAWQGATVNGAGREQRQEEDQRVSCHMQGLPSDPLPADMPFDARQVTPSLCLSFPIS